MERQRVRVSLKNKDKKNTRIRLACLLADRVPPRFAPKQKTEGINRTAELGRGTEKVKKGCGGSEEDREVRERVR